MLSITVAHAEIRSTVDLNTVKQEVLASDKDTLVIFDVDMVLIMPTDEIFIKYVDHESGPFLEGVYKELNARHSPEQVDKYKSIISLSGHVQTVTPETPHVLNEIDRAGYKIIGLTLCETGSFGKISSLEKWRVDELKSLGIKFHHSFPNVTAGQLDKYIPNIQNYTSKYECSPCVVAGILFTCHVPKGEVLDAYLQQIDVKPRKIVFVDDKLKNLETVAKYCDQNNIAFVGFEYNAVKEQAKKFPMDLRLARLQFNVLEHAEVWLSDEQARNILHNLDK